MARLGNITQKIRSKNAGPFWLTIDIFCGTSEVFKQTCASLSTDDIAKVFGADVTLIKRFEIANLNVVKISLPRPVTQGDVRDHDQHGASWANLVAALDI